MPHYDRDAVKRANPIEQVIPALLNASPVTVGRELKVRCPFHEDSAPSLRINADKQTWFCDPCQVGGDAIAFVQKWRPCEFADALTFLAERAGMVATSSTASRSIVATYPYRDETGGLLYEAVRYKPKDFRQRRPTGDGQWAWKLDGVRRVVYRLPELQSREAVFVCEGEKDCDAAWAAGLPATTNVSGAGKWREEYTQQLVTAGIKRIAVVPDNDDPGRAHADAVARSCHAAGLQVRIITLPDVPTKGDLSDYLAKHTKGELLELTKATPAYVPALEKDTATTPTTCESSTEIVLGDLLRDLAAFISKYVVLAGGQVAAIVLWVLHTHVVAAADCTPYLQITSATKRAGKTRLLEVLEHVVARPWFTGRTSAAALVRKVDADQPTLLLDESDAAFNGEKDYAETLRGILNSGYRRSGRVTLCVGQGANLTFKDFATFGPKAIAGIGALPDTVADRAITIKLQRKTTDEPCARWRERDGRIEAAPLFDACKAWATAARIAACRAGHPMLPLGLGDRQTDVWEPLLVIAEMAGSEWSDVARKAATALTGSVEDTDVTVELLRDIAGHVLDGHESDVILSTTKDVIPKLIALEDRPWASWRHDKQITPRGLARLLGPLGIHPTSTGSLRGYRRDAFTDVIARYLPFYVSKRQNTNGNGPEPAISMCQDDRATDACKSTKTPVNIEVLTL